MRLRPSEGRLCCWPCLLKIAWTLNLKHCSERDRHIATKKLQHSSKYVQGKGAIYEFMWRNDSKVMLE